MKRLLVPVIALVLLAACSRTPAVKKSIEKKSSNNSATNTEKESQKNKQSISITFPLEEPGKTTVKKIVTTPTSEAVIKALMSNSGKNGTADLFPKGTKLLGAKTKKGIAYVNFNNAVTVNPGVGGEGEAAFLNSLVDSLTELEGIKAVGLEAEGIPLEELWGHFDISQPLKKGSI